MVVTAATVIAHLLSPVLLLRLNGLQYVHQAPLCSTISWNFLKFMSIELVILSNHLILCRPLFLLPSIFPSITVFSNESALHIRWPKYWSFTFSINLAMNNQGWFPLGLTGLIFLFSKGLSKSLLQHHS